MVFKSTKYLILDLIVFFIVFFCSDLIIEKNLLSNRFYLSTFELLWAGFGFYVYWSATKATQIKKRKK